MTSQQAAFEERVETYRGVAITWEKTTDETGCNRVRFQCALNGEILRDNWIDGVRGKIDAALDAVPAHS